MIDPTTFDFDTITKPTFIKSVATNIIELPKIPTTFDFDTVTKPVVIKTITPKIELPVSTNQKTSLVPIVLLVGGLALGFGTYLFYLSKKQKKNGNKNI